MNRFEQLLIAEIPALRRYARALSRDFGSADDLVQECLARAVARRRLWISERGMRPWLFTILHNIYIDSMRRHSASADVEMSDGNREKIAAEQDADLLCTLSDFEQALYQLSPEQREVLLLVGLEQMNYREVAKVTGVPVGTVMSRLSRAREMLSRGLDGIPQPANLQRVK